MLTSRARGHMPDPGPHILGNDTLKRARRALGSDHPLAESLERMLKPTATRLTDHRGSARCPSSAPVMTLEKLCGAGNTGINTGDAQGGEHDG